MRTQKEPRYAVAIIIGLTLGTCLALATPGVASAQTRALPGSRVRVTSELLDKPVRGELVELNAHYLVLRPKNPDSYGTELLRLPRNNITTVEVSTGKKSNWLGGAALGAGVGALIGVLEWATKSETKRECTWGLFGGGGCRYVPNDMGPEVILIGAASAALLGAGIGALIKSDKWEAVELPAIEPMVSVHVRPGEPASLYIGFRMRGF
jgi:hypothetical protein